MIFNLFKSKPTLRELIPKGFVDIHSHILPGIDDGAKDIHESLKLISEMKKIGFSKIIGTPHTYPGLYNNSDKSIKASFDTLKNKLNEEIEIDYSSEYMIDESLFKKINDSKLLTLKDNYILIEMSYISAPIYLNEIIFELQLAGYIPVLAHPERYLFMFNDINKYFKLKSLGCNFQMNLLSSTGYYGNKVANFCDKLLKNKLVDFVGSDIHSIDQINKMHDRIVIKEIKNFTKSIEANILFD